MSGGPVQRTPEWYAARRLGITSTDIVAILGLSKWTSEGDVAREKAGTGEPPAADPATERRWRIGRGLEAVIQAEDEAEHGIKLRRVTRLLTHPTIPWAVTSLDFERIGERTIVEAKSSTSRDWDAGLPEAVEAQVRWQMGVAGYPRTHVAALRYGRDLVCTDVEHDEATFQQLVAIADDFRARLAAGGPFDESHASVRRAYPSDDGTAIVADEDVAAAVGQLITVRATIRAAEDFRDTLETAIQTRMGPATTMTGPGFSISWKRSRDSRATDWAAVADAVLPLEATARASIIERYTEARPGSRRFIIRERDET